MHINRRVRPSVVIGVTAVAAAFSINQGITASAASYGGTAASGFTSPVIIPASSGLGEPSIIHDDGVGNGGVPRLFVTAPQAIGNINGSGGSPLFTSLNGGATWSAPVRSQECTGLSGGDTDLAVDTLDNLFQTDLWLGNSCLSASADHGATFCAGNPYGNQPIPGDDRPWLTYNSHSSQLYATYDGETGIFLTNTAATNTLPRGTCPATAIQTLAQSTVVPEVPISSSTPTPGVRQCVCPPGGDAVDNTVGQAHSHTNRVYVSYSYQGGTEVSYMDPTGCPTACVSTTWTQGALIADATGNSAFQDEFNFSPVKVDGNGTVYVMWAHALNWDDSNRVAGAGGVQEYYAYSNDGGATWSAPVLLSTEAGTTNFPTMDVVAPGIIDASWYGTTATGDPNTVPANAQWNVYYTRVTNAGTATPTVAAPEVAIADMHNGCIQSGGGASCSDRSLLDFYQLTDIPCASGTGSDPNIIYTGGDATNGVDLYFTKLDSATACVATLAANVPEAPWTPLLVVPAGIAAFFAVRLRRRARTASNL